MSKNKDLAPIIKKIKKNGHGGHTAAWKIAYADFVTAMMAFFLLLWLLSTSSKETLTSIADYFAPTIGIKDREGIGFAGGIGDSKIGKKDEKATPKAIIFGAPTIGMKAQVSPRDDINDQKRILDAQDKKNFSEVQSDLYKAIESNPETKDMVDNINIIETPEGLKISVMDDEKRSMFKRGTNELEDFTKKTLVIISKYIKYMPNYLAIGGHTNSIVSPGTDNWQLSSSRSLSTRAFLVDGLIDHEQVFRVEGKADQEPFDIEHPQAAKNSRISLILLKNSVVPYQKRSAPESILSNSSDDL